MIIISRRHLFFIFAFLAVALVPFPFVNLGPMPLDARYVPIVIAIEAVIYLLFAMIANPEAGWNGAALVSASLLILRAGLNLLGGMLLCLAPDYTLMQAWTALDLGNLIGSVIQMLLAMMLAPYMLAPSFPNIVSADALPIMEGAPAGSDAAARPRSVMRPMGGFIQVYSYEELTEAFRKVVGLEGFMLYSDEGLKLWSKFEMGLDEESAAISSNQMFADVRAWAQKLRLRDAERFFAQTPDHFICNAVLSERVRLLLVFTSQVLLADAMERADLATRTAADFIRSRGESS